MESKTETGLAYFPPSRINRYRRKSATRIAFVAIGYKLAVVLLRRYGLFPVQFGEGLAFLGQALQQRGRFPEFAVLLVKF